MRTNERHSPVGSGLTPVMSSTLSVAQLAQALQVTPGHVSHLIREGEIPALKGLGRRQLVAAWRLTSFLATGDWDHPDYRPHRLQSAVTNDGSHF